jgi:alpha-1,3-rhamnosyl/mannosyltransferase
VAGLAAFKSRLVLVDSTWGGHEVQELLGVPERKIRVIPLAPTPGLGPASAERVKAYQDERKLPRDYLLYVGARKQHKNLALLLDALGRVAPGDRTPLVLSGPRWMPDDPLARQCAANGLEPWLYFAGNPETVEELSMLYSGAMMYLHPSLSEGFGLPPLEAMACGVPVIASDVAALPETLGDAALLVPPHGPEAWAAAITQLTRDTWGRTQLAVAGRAHAATFSWERTAEQTLAAYLEALT